MDEKIGFLIGAGASYELGLPLVDELTMEFKKALCRTKETPYYKVPKEIEPIVFSLLQDNNLNYEDVIGRIEVEIQRCRGNDELYQKWNALLAKYLETVFFLLLERHYKNKTFICERLDLFKPLKEYCTKNPVWIFSLNHDLSIEVVAKYLEIDLIGTYKITNNLSYMVGMGYLFTGDYFKGFDDSSEVNDNFILINKLTLTF